MYEAFASPFEPSDGGLLKAIAVEYARGYTRRFLDRFRLEIARSSLGLTDFLAKSISNEVDFEAVWCPAFSELRRGVLDRSDLATRMSVDRAVAAGLHLALAGHKGSWEVALPTRRLIRVGRLLFGPLRRLGVESDHHQVKARVAGRVTVLPATTLGKHQATLLRMPHRRAAMLVGESLEPIHHEDGQLVRGLGHAVSLLSRYSPRYLAWVDRVVRGVHPLVAKPSVMRSSSGLDAPGVIWMSFPASPVQHAEMLVHEATHQYFYLLSRLGPIVDPRHTAQYYSPVKRTKRPLDRILLAYHAFANVLLFYRACLRRGIRDKGYCRRNEATTIPQLMELDRILRSTTALTPLGHALWQPLAARVAL